ncbi:hypothetical protein GC174_09990 [bacterium]|nr:hypothetical protein [bacterium]
MKRSDPPVSQSSMERLIQHFAGWVLYPLGDLFGQIIMDDVNPVRYIAVMIAGGIIYRFEIPRWFHLLDSFRLSSDTENRYPFFKKLVHEDDTGLRFNWLGKTLGAALYFNPLWIARHLFLIKVATLVGPDMHWYAGVDFVAIIIASLKSGTVSFFTNLPIALTGNYLIQERMNLRYRFVGSAALTTVLNAKYAIEFVIFSKM